MAHVTQTAGFIRISGTRKLAAVPDLIVNDLVFLNRVDAAVGLELLPVAHAQ